ncbi:hypothetical protein H632_c4045p0, partial [Helicosporidium sp. ATCC 50920]
MAPSTLAFCEAHSAGACDAVYCTAPDGQIYLATCGADSKLCFRHDKDVGRVLASVGEAQGPLSALAMPPSGAFVVVADSEYVKMRSIPSGEEGSTLTRFVLPPRALAASPCGGLVAAGGDDEGVKLIALSSARVLRVLAAPAYTRGLAFDPEGAYVAVSSADGTLSVWEAASGRNMLTKKRACPRLEVGGGPE